VHVHNAMVDTNSQDMVCDWHQCHVGVQWVKLKMLAHIVVVLRNSGRSVVSRLPNKNVFDTYFKRSITSADQADGFGHQNETTCQCCTHNNVENHRRTFLIASSVGVPHFGSACDARCFALVSPEWFSI
jgi:hypothetical protein